MPRLLVSNCTLSESEGGVYLLDTDRRTVRRVHDLPCRGITEGPDGYYAVGNKGAVYHLDPHTWTSRLRAKHDLDGAHDLRWTGDGFFLVASYGNWVLRLDRDLQIVDRFQVVEDPGDVCHANCLLQSDGELLLSIFTLSPGRREEKRRTPAWRTEGKILRLDWPGKRFEILHEPLSQPHSLTLRNGRLYCCESQIGRVTWFDRATGERGTAAVGGLNSFARGLAFHGDRAYVGLSRSRQPMGPLRKLLARLGTRCGVLELDAEGWRPLRTYRLPGRETYELLVLPD